MVKRSQVTSGHVTLPVDPESPLEGEIYMENGGHNYKFSNQTGRLSSPHRTPFVHYHEAVAEVLVRDSELVQIYF